MRSLLLTVFVVTTLSGCAARVHRVPETRYSVFAIVQEVDRTRLAGAEVAIGNARCRTTALGACRLVLAPGDYPLLVAARGYRPYESAIRILTDVMLRVPLLKEAR
jgi:hypothetical protein